MPMPSFDHERAVDPAAHPAKSTSSTTKPRPDASRSSWSPNYDLKRIDPELIAFVDIPGIDEDDLEIEILPRSLIVRGERPFDHDLEDAEEYLHLARPYGFFRLNVDLPVAVDPNLATAKYRRGVLRVRMPVTDQPYCGTRIRP